MSVDNRTIINNCDSATGWSGDDTATVITTTGSFYEGTGALTTQLSNSDEHMYTTENSQGGGTFNLNWSASTVYMIIKDNLGSSFANGGTQLVLGDGTDRIGYDVGGNDAVGMPVATYFQSYKLDVSQAAATPGGFATYAGSEANLNHAAITQVGYGALHLAKAVGSVDNAIMDCFRYIANTSCALTINGGTVGTPETMADVVADDITGGWGLVANPIGDQYQFFGSTEWGESVPAANHYFTGSNEQWYWIGDNAGGRPMGAGNFPFQVVGNATDTGSFVINNVQIINTGTGSEFSCSDVNVDTLEIDGCTMVGLASFDAPSSGGTSRFCIDTIFSQCGQVTHNGAVMTGCSFLGSTVAANGAAMFYDLTSDPDGELDGGTYSQGTAAHHAITFGTNIPLSITIRDCDFRGFSASNDNDGSIFRFNDTVGVISLNLVNCTHDGSGFSVDTRAGATVNIIIDPVTTTVNVIDNVGANLSGARVLLEASDGTGDYPFEESVTITRTLSTATVTHTAHGLVTGDYAVIRGAAQPEYNGAHQVTVVTANTYTYTVSGSPTSPATGTIISSGAIISGVTNGAGTISATRTFGANTPVKGVVRKSTTSPRFKSFGLTGTIDSALGLTINVRMIIDE